jgi:hypothetical protein
MVQLRRGLSRLALLSASGLVVACTSTSTAPSDRQSDLRRGFLERLTDQLTERDCNVAYFTCPYGLGPAGEPCECIDPRGYVLNGRTVK